MRKISDLDLSRQPDLAYARDLFLLSFYLRGMSFIDMAFLRKSDLHGNNLSYRRHKTGKLLSVKWTKEMQSIVNRYSKGRSEYLLPILQTDPDNSRIAYKNISYNINRKLKIIARMAKIDIPLTFYCARHTWASIAHSEGIPITIISEGMGHRSENTTRIYLASLDSSTIDKANRSIIKLLHR